MSHDLAHLSDYLKDEIGPAQIAKLLDEVLYDLVQHEGELSDREDFVEKFFQVRQLRNQFANMDENLSRVWK